MSRQAELQTSKWSCCYVKTEIASQESDLFLSDVLTNSTSNIYLLISLCRNFQSSLMEEQMQCCLFEAMFHLIK